MPVPVSAARSSLGHLFPGGGRGVGLGSRRHHSGCPQPGVWTNGLAQKWPSGDSGMSRKVSQAVTLLPQQRRPAMPTLESGARPALHAELGSGPSLAASGGTGAGRALSGIPKAHPCSTDGKLRPREERLGQVHRETVCVQASPIRSTNTDQACSGAGAEHRSHRTWFWARGTQC